MTMKRALAVLILASPAAAMDVDLTGDCEGSGETDLVLANPTQFVQCLDSARTCDAWDLQWNCLHVKINEDTVRSCVQRHVSIREVETDCDVCAE